MDRGIEETKQMKIEGSKNEAKREPNIPQMGPKSTPGPPNWSKITTRGGQMTPRGRFGDQLGSGSDPRRAPGGLRELPGAQKVDFGSTLGGQKLQKVTKIISKVEKMRVEERRGEKNKSKLELECFFVDLV